MRARPADASSSPSRVDRLSTLTIWRTRNRALMAATLAVSQRPDDPWRPSVADLQLSAQLKTAHPEGQRERPDEAPATAFAQQRLRRHGANSVPRRPPRER